MEIETLQKIGAQHEKYNDQMIEEFLELFMKWGQKAPELTAVNMAYLPVTLLMSPLFPEMFGVAAEMPDVPYIFSRTLKPFETIKDLWGKIPHQEFCELYQKHYLEEMVLWKSGSIALPLTESFV